MRLKISLLILLVAPALSSASGPIFVDRASDLGLDFTHFNGMSGETYFPEIMGSGAAVFDFDLDGDLDVYLIQGAMLGPDKSIDQATFKPEHPLPLTDRLYRNDMQPGKPDTLKFTDVTEQSGISAQNYGMGVSVADVDNNGWPDLYVSNLGANQLWLNRGNGKFEERAAEMGVDDARWSITGVFFDYDDDGWLDLYVVNYVDFSFSKAKTCRSYNGNPDYCSPQSYQAAADGLFRSVEGKRFQDISASAGIAEIAAPGLGGVAGDFNGDRKTDLYIANDGAANFMWVNQGQGKFMDEALFAGVAVNMSGNPEASMGVDAADFDSDGDLDLFMTHLNRQTNTLYVNDGQGWFLDQTGTSVLGTSSFSFTGFGTLWFDYDNDGHLDLMSANGAVVKQEKQDQAGDPLPLKQKNQLWRNTGKGAYEDVSEKAGDAFAAEQVSRGAAFGDLDNDGDTDIIVTNNAGKPQLLINQVGQRQQWLGLDLEHVLQGRYLGTQVSIEAGGRKLTRRARSDGSYASANDSRVLFGLASAAQPIKVQLQTPDGKTRELGPFVPGRYHKVELKN